MTRRLSGALFSVALLVVLALPSQAAAATPFVKFVSLPGSYPGGYATATVATKAGASCSIVVNYMSGPSHAQGLTTKTAASNGRVSWTWKVGTRTTRGSWPVVVSCRKGGSSGSATKNLVVS
jgi:hypothetical protein